MNPEMLIIRLIKPICIIASLFALFAPIITVICLLFMPEAYINRFEMLKIYSVFFKDPKFKFLALALFIYDTCFFIIGFHFSKSKNLFNRIVFVSICFFVWLFVSNIIVSSCKFLLKNANIKSISDFFSGSIIEMGAILTIIIITASPILFSLFLIFSKIKKKKDIRIKKTLKKNVKTENSTYNLTLKSTKQPININNPFRGIYIQGGAGSGKTVSLIEPLLAQMAYQGYTGILYDFKSPELSLKSLELYKCHKHIKSYFIDFKEPNKSNRVNPIKPEYLRKTAFASEYSLALINNMIPESVKHLDFWSRNSWMLLSGVIWYMKNNYPHYCTLPHVISLLLQTDIDKLILKVSEDYEAGGMIASVKQSMDRGAEKQVAGILSTLQNALSTLNTPDIFWILSGDELSLDLNNPADPKFLNIGNDSTLSSTYSPVISLIITVALRQMNKENRAKSVVLLDEAPTIYIPNFDQIPATARSNKIATVLGVQDFSQMIDQYGKEKAQAILSNLGNQFFGRTVNLSTAEMITRLFGKQDMTFKTKSVGNGTSGQFVHLNSNVSHSTGESIQERDRIKISDITNLEAGEFCGIISEGNPREFIKMQLDPSYIEKSNVQLSNITSDEEMRINYLKIIEEAKSIF